MGNHSGHQIQECPCKPQESWKTNRDDYRLILNQLVHNFKELYDAKNPRVSTEPITNYELTGFIGKGAYGSVFRAVHQEQRTCGLKMQLKRECMFNTVVREITLLALADHPNIYRIYHTMDNETSYGMDIEFAEFLSMGKVIYNLSYLMEDEACFYMAQLVMALEYLHCIGIAHTDIKPENMVLNVDGYLKVADFGGVTYLPSYPDLMVSRIAGTMGYKPREARLSQGCSFAVDWYSAGISMFRFLTGKRLFKLKGNEAELQITDEYRREELQSRLDALGVAEERENVSPMAMDLIFHLTMTDQWRRLGNRVAGDAEVRTHPWFNHINWSSLYRQKYIAPMFPHLRLIQLPTIAQTERLFPANLIREKDDPIFPCPPPKEEQVDNADGNSNDNKEMFLSAASMRNAEMSKYFD